MCCYEHGIDLSMFISIPMNGGTTPIDLRNPSTNRAKKIEPKNMLIIDAFLLCRVMAAAIS